MGERRRRLGVRNINVEHGGSGRPSRPEPRAARRSGSATARELSYPLARLVSPTLRPEEKTA